MHCPKTGNNLCCSYKGYCGDSDGHCGADCQSSFGICKQAVKPKVTQCGPKNGNAKCSDNECCSPAGFCGKTQSYCKSPDCLLGFGRCDASVIPSGSDTGLIDRKLTGTVSYDKDIYHCINKGDIALTYDDGPYNFTEKILDQLKDYNMKATFFVTGINLGKGAIDDPQFGWDKVIRRMIAEGHQVASHTWSHADLSKISKEMRRDEVMKLEMALRNILGSEYIPTYIRPPYSSCNAECKSDLKEMGYHVTYFDLDTDDYNRATSDKIKGAADIFVGNITKADPKKDKFLAIAHDIQELTATELTASMLKAIKEKGFRGVTVGECLGDAPENWYRGERIDYLKSAGIYDQEKAASEKAATGGYIFITPSHSDASGNLGTGTNFYLHALKDESAAVNSTALNDTASATGSAQPTGLMNPFSGSNTAAGTTDKQKSGSPESRKVSILALMSLFGVACWAVLLG
ncbi:hypothetical protein FPQ18DRAFT_258413 [Pyronema domesticum]|nr:hypothetical protein FPQ18DRAFT_258413 [Pyronema domesticum]